MLAIGYQLMALGQKHFYIYNDAEVDRAFLLQKKTEVIIFITSVYTFSLFT